MRFLPGWQPLLSSTVLGGYTPPDGTLTWLKKRSPTVKGPELISAVGAVVVRSNSLMKPSVSCGAKYSYAGVAPPLGMPL